jgi:hypothetical protein
MATVKIRMTMKELVRYQLRLARDFKPAAERGVLSGALRCIPILTRSTDEMKAFNTGDYRRAWDAERIDNGARVFNKKSYAGVIELGRRKGKRQPPSKVIEHWAQRKLGLSETEARSAAFAIAQSIGKKGIKGKHVMGRVRDEMSREVLAEVRRELNLALRGRHI